MFGPDLQDFHMKLLNDQTDGAPSAKEMGVALWPEAQQSSWSACPTSKCTWNA